VRLEYWPMELRTRHPFVISRGGSESYGNVFVNLHSEGETGWGEAAPSRYYGEDQSTVVAVLGKFSVAVESGSPSVRALQERMDGLIRLNPAAKAAVDMARYDLLGKQLKTPVWSLLGLSKENTPQTSFTIGIAEPEVMLEKAEEAKGFPILKIKMGVDHDVSTVRKIAAGFKGRIRVDVNGAWGFAEAVRKMKALSEIGVEFVEQPLPPERDHELPYLRQAVDIPVFVDESVRYAKDLVRLHGCVDGISIKLMKCGGLTPALDMIATARALSFKVMVGCMVESSLAISAAAQLSPLVDYLDLDGHLLLARDPFAGVRFKDGKLELLDEPGLGVRKREE